MNNKIPYIVFDDGGAIYSCYLTAIFSSLCFDFATRQKVGGTSMNFFYVKQLPILTFDKIPDTIKPSIIERVAELCYFNHDLDGWMFELWNDDEMTDDIRADLLVRLAECNNLSFDSGQLATPDFSLMSPYIYNEERRAVAQAELDAIFAHLYGLTTEELRYILDPEDVCGKVASTKPSASFATMRCVSTANTALNALCWRLGINLDLIIKKICLGKKT